MEKKKLWDMKKVLNWARNLVVNNKKAGFVPCLRPGTKTIAMTKCEWCGAENKLFVFVSEDKQHYLGICKECRKHEIRLAKGANNRPQDDRCLATTVRGKRCRNKALDDGFCATHSPKKAPQAVQNTDGSGSIHGEMVGLGM